MQEPLKDKKTNIVIIVAALLLIGQLAGFWVVPEELWGALGLTGVAALRLAIKKAEK